MCSVGRVRGGCDVVGHLDVGTLVGLGIGGHLGDGSHLGASGGFGLVGPRGRVGPGRVRLARRDAVVVPQEVSQDDLERALGLV